MKKDIHPNYHTINFEMTDVAQRKIIDSSIYLRYGWKSIVSLDKRT